MVVSGYTLSSSIGAIEITHHVVNLQANTLLLCAASTMSTRVYFPQHAETQKPPVTYTARFRSRIRPVRLFMIKSREMCNNRVPVTVLLTISDRHCCNIAL